MQPKPLQSNPTEAQLPIARELSTASKLRVRIGFWKKNWNPTLEEARHAAAEIASREHLDATESDIEDAATLHVFSQAVRNCDLPVCEPLAQHAFEIMRDDPTHILVHRDWVQLLLHSHRPEAADTAALAYLKYIHEWDPSAVHTRNAIALWSRLLQLNRAALPKSAAFLAANFPNANLHSPEK